jgi:hypothetical protein
MVYVYTVLHTQLIVHCMKVNMLLSLRMYNATLLHDLKQLMAVKLENRNLIVFLHGVLLYLIVLSHSL